MTEYYGGIKCLTDGQGGIVYDYGGGYPWDGNPNVAAMWIANPSYITGSDVESWITQQAYTGAGASTTYTRSASGSARPLFNATGANGYGSVEYDGTAEVLVCTDTEFNDLLNGDDTDIIVLQVIDYLSGGASGDQFWQFSGGSLAPSYRLIRASTRFRIDIQDDAGSGFITNTFEQTAAYEDAFHVHAVQRDGTQLNMFHDGFADANNPRTANVGTISNHDVFATAARQDNAAASPTSFTAYYERATAIIINNDTTALDQITDYFINEQGIT